MSSPAPSPAADEPVERSPFCPSCGAGLPPDQTRCWLCYDPLEGPASGLRAAVINERLAASHPWQFSIDTILLVTTLAAVLLGVFQYSPGLAVGLIVLAFPALVRTVYVGRREKRRGQRISAGGKIFEFILSLLIMIAAWTVAATSLIAAAVVTCFAAIAASSVSDKAAERVGVVGIIIGAFIGLVFAVFLVWETWPKHK